MRTTGFQSPTGNIRCALQTDDHTQLLCKTLNNGNAVDLDSLLEPDTNVTATISEGPTLGYGRGWSSANFYCWSRFTGVTCRSLASSSGFEINRDGITNLVWDHAVLGSGGGASSGSTGGSSSGGDFCSTHSCIDNFDNGGGYIVQCNDGMWSHSGGLSGACSYHGGESSNVYTGSNSTDSAGSNNGPSSGSGGDLGPGNGYTVTCADGTISHSGGIQGACSHHGGVG